MNRLTKADRDLEIRADEIDYLYREARGCSLDICLGLVDWLHELRVLLYG